MNTNSWRVADALAPIDMRAPAGEAATEAWTLRVVASAKHGDRQAVRWLYSRYAAGVRMYVGSLLRDADAVEDVVQTTFLKVLTRIDRYEARDVPFEAWLLRVARNAAFDELRRRRTRESLPILEGDAVVEADDLGPALWEALDRLPAAWREVLVLRHVVGLSVAEVAERLGSTTKAVSALQERACAGLRECMSGAPAPRTGRFEPRRRSSESRPVVEQLG
jgi:RNA polymerase sigma-70 factor (ECF subfamily)